MTALQAGWAAATRGRLALEPATHVYLRILYVYGGPRLKTKLTVTIDEDLVPRAKRHARSRGLSLSQLIENALREMSAGETASFSHRWRGKFRPAARADERYRALTKKYL